MKPKRNTHQFASNILLRSTIIALGLEGTLQADTWDYGAATQNWLDALNWSADVVPASNVNVTINHAVAGQTPIITSVVNRTGFDTWIGNGAAGVLDINAGGSVSTSTKWIFIGTNNGGNGTLNVNAGGSLTSDNHIRICEAGTSTGRLNVNGGTVTVANVNSKTSNGSIAVSAGGTLSATNGSVLFGGASSISGVGSTVTASDQVFVGNGATGVLDVSAGSVSSATWFVVGINAGGNATLNLSGGTVNATTTNPGAFTTIGANSTSVGVVNQSGGTWNQGGVGIQMAEGGTGQATYNLTGGDLYTPRIYKGGGTSATLNLNGGVLHAKASNTSFISAGVLTNIGTSGATIDSSTFDVTVVPDLNSAGSDGGLTKTGSGSVTLAGLLNYDGATTVTGGKLLFGGTPATSGVTVAANAGIGVEDPGDILTVPTVSFGAAATLDIETDVNDYSELLEVTASGGLSFSTLGVNLFNYNLPTGSLSGTYSLIQYTDSYTGNIADLSVVNPRAGYTYIFADDTVNHLITVQVIAADSDSDGMDDEYEIANGLDPNDDGSVLFVNGPNGNLDGDFATNYEEYLAGTAANNPDDDPLDLDNDGLLDDWEITYFTNITAQNETGDPDGDLATNLEEFLASSNPTFGDSWPDADSDNMNDAWEDDFLGGTATSDGTADTDGDGFTDLEEHTAHTDPSLATGGGISPIWTTLAHRWSFNGNLTDSVGGSDAQIIDVGVNGVAYNDIVTPTAITMTGGAKADSDYIKLGENLLPKSTTPVTIELWAKQNAVQNWSRIFDFNSGTDQYLMMNWTIATNNASDRVELRDLGTTTTSLIFDNANQPYGITDEQHMVLTLEPLAGSGGTTRVTVYSAPSSATDLGSAKASGTTSINLVNLSDALDALGYSPWPDNTASATYNEVRIWNGVLSGWMAEKMHDLGPDNVTVDDLDGDHLPDDWETQYFANTTTVTSMSGDEDSDTFTNYEEYAAGSNPNDSASTPDDLDADGLADAWEILYFGNLDQLGTDDPDGDGADNETEETNLTDPTDDEDGLPADYELFWFGSTTTQTGADDSDSDSSSNLDEYLVSQPNNIASTPTDVNGDGVPDSDPTQHTLATADVLGTTSFDTGLNWNDAAAPVAGGTYIVTLSGLRTPSTPADVTFAGDRLDLVEIYTGRPKLVLKYTGATPITTTFPLLNMNGGEIQNAADVGIAHKVAGTINISGPMKSFMFVNNGPLIVDAALTGSGDLECYSSNSVTLNGTNTFTGNLNVINDNGLILGATGNLSFVIGASGVNNAITGTGPVTLNGAFDLDLTGATSNPADAWDLVTSTGATTIGATFSVSGFTADAGAVGSRIWNNGTYQFAEATGILSLYTPPSSGFDTWASGAGLTATVNDGATQDPENDGIENVLEFVLGGNPLASDTGILPTLDASGANFVFTFTRADESEAEVSTTFQYGSDLSGWTDVVIGADNAGSGSEANIVEDGANPDQITVTIPKGANTKLFGRIQAVK